MIVIIKYTTVKIEFACDNVDLELITYCYTNKRSIRFSQAATVVMDHSCLLYKNIQTLFLMNQTKSKILTVL